jgi:hypothetical protein
MNELDRTHVDPTRVHARLTPCVREYEVVRKFTWPYIYIILMQENGCMPLVCVQSLAVFNFGPTFYIKAF